MNKATNPWQRVLVSTAIFSILWAGIGAAMGDYKLTGHLVATVVHGGIMALWSKKKLKEAA